MKGGGIAYWLFVGYATAVVICAYVLFIITSTNTNTSSVDGVVYPNDCEFVPYWRCKLDNFNANVSRMLRWFTEVFLRLRMIMSPLTGEFGFEELFNTDK